MVYTTKLSGLNISLSHFSLVCFPSPLSAIQTQDLFEKVMLKISTGAKRKTLFCHISLSIPHISCLYFCCLLSWSTDWIIHFLPYTRPHNHKVNNFNLPAQHEEYSFSSGRLVFCCSNGLTMYQWVWTLMIREIWLISRQRADLKIKHGDGGSRLPLPVAADYLCDFSFLIKLKPKWNISLLTITCTDFLDISTETSVSEFQEQWAPWVQHERKGGNRNRLLYQFLNLY